MDIAASVSKNMASRLAMNRYIAELLKETSCGLAALTPTCRVSWGTKG